MKTKILYSTNPHGAQTVAHITDACDNTEPENLCGNSLVQIESADSKVVLTAEEMDDLANQWFKLRR